MGEVMNFELVLNTFATGPSLLVDLIEDIPNDYLYSRAESKWSIAEHSNHICKADEYVFQPRLQL